jgi:DNA-binding response OmpR family regulator
MLTAKGREVEVAKGLALGADVCITKPFSTKELLAQVRHIMEPSESNRP